MRIGLDLDNTIACYDRAIAVLAEELLELPKYVHCTKAGLSDYLRREGRESEWTAFQGELYGPGMRFAQPFEGAINTMVQLENQGHELMVVSHRSRRPYAGQQHDLHCFGMKWVNENLRVRGLFNDRTTAINFLDSQEKKLSRITELECDVFVDDLPKVLLSIQFPEITTGVLFDPMGCNRKSYSGRAISRWIELIETINSL